MQTWKKITGRALPKKRLLIRRSTGIKEVFTYAVGCFVGIPYSLAGVRTIKIDVGTISKYPDDEWVIVPANEIEYTEIPR